MKNVVVIMKGGLGNQLFQYAFARNIQLKYGYDGIILDISELDGIRDRKYALQDFELPGNCVTTCSDNRYARYSRRRNPFLRAGMHICPKVVYDVGTFGNAFIWDRTELIDIERLAATADTFLHKKHRAAVFPFYEIGANCYYRGENKQQKT